MRCSSGEARRFESFESFVSTFRLGFGTTTKALGGTRDVHAEAPASAKKLNAWRRAAASEPVPNKQASLGARACINPLLPTNRRPTSRTDDSIGCVDGSIAATHACRIAHVRHRTLRGERIHTRTSIDIAISKLVRLGKKHSNCRAESEDLKQPNSVTDKTSNMATAPDIPLLITSENSSSERRITPSWSVSQLKGRLEPITGIPASCQRLSLKVASQAPQPIEAQNEDATQLASWPLQAYAEIYVGIISDCFIVRHEQCGRCTY